MQRICTVVVLAVFVYGCVPVSTDGVAHLDVFHEILDKLAVPSGSDVLPVQKLEEFFDKVLHRFKCENNGSALSGFEAETALGTCSELLVSRSTDYLMCTLKRHGQSRTERHGGGGGRGFSGRCLFVQTVCGDNWTSPTVLRLLLLLLLQSSGFAGPIWTEEIGIFYKV